MKMLVTRAITFLVNPPGGTFLRCPKLSWLPKDPPPKDPLDIEAWGGGGGSDLRRE